MHASEVCVDVCFVWVGQIKDLIVFAAYKQNLGGGTRGHPRLDHFPEQRENRWGIDQQAHSLPKNMD